MNLQKFCSFVILIIVAGGFFISGKISLADTVDHLVISEIQINGNEFVELYNPTLAEIDLSDYFLSYYSDARDWDNPLHNQQFPAGTNIKSFGFYLVGFKGYPTSGGSVNPDWQLTANPLANDNGSIVIFPWDPKTKNIDELHNGYIDAISWGTTTVKEGASTPAPSLNQSLERKASEYSTVATLSAGGLEENSGNGYDNDDNANDFVVQNTPNPQNSSSPPEKNPPLTAPPSCAPNWSCTDWQPTADTICSEETFTQNRVCTDLNNCEVPDGKPDETQQSAGTKDCSTPTEINPGDIVINEFVADPSDSDTEWIELYNKTVNDLDLTNLTIEDGNESPKSLTDHILPNGFVVLTKGTDFTFALNNSGDVIKLKNTDGTIIDQVTYGNWNDGNIPDNAPAASDPNSVARKTDGEDSDNDAADFAVTTTLTKSATNIITAPPTPETGGGGSAPTNSTPSSPPSWPVGSLLINEFVADPADGDVEWIEFYNSTAESIDLTKWTVEDGGETATNLSGSIGPHGFYVLEKPKGILNNSGDEIILKDPAGIIIDQVTYGNWDDGDTSDNAPAANDQNSVARKIDGQNTANDFNDFIIATPTKGTSNAGGLIQTPTGAYSREIIVNEIFPNPKGDDSQNEFIELKNIGSAEIDLVDWKIGDASSKTYTIRASDFSSTILKPNEFFVLYRKVTGIALNNSGTESAKLFAPDGTLVSSVEYSGSAAEDQSFARGDGMDYFWTTTPTPGKENIITRANQSPTAVISAPDEGEIGETINFDGSDSTDPDGDTLTFFWDFGNGTTFDGPDANHIYLAAGKYKITLTVKDVLGAVATAENFIDIKNPAGEEIPSPTSPSETATVVINEVLPNPVGSDDTEWLELWNAGSEPFDLSGFKLDDDEGGSRPYKIPDGTVIAPGQFLIFKKDQTKLAFNNTFDAVRLLDPNDEVYFETSYDEVTEGAAWARDENGDWKWTTSPTPGTKNIFQFQEKIAAKKSSSSLSSKKSTTFNETTLEEIRNFDLGSGVHVTGQVIVEPGILGSQIFYIANEEACPGIQIYMYKKDFPELKLGDLVEVSGTLTETSGEKRIKVSTREDIKILENKEPPTPSLIKLSEVEENLEGCLITASGEVTEKSGSNLYFADDDGELRIYFKSSLDFPKPKLDIGDQIETVGIVSQTATGFRLLPRYESDIKLKTLAENSENSIENNASQIEIPGHGQKNKVVDILGAAAGVLGLTLIGLGIKTGTFANWWKKIKKI